METQTLGHLAESVRSYDPAGAVSWARRAIREGIDPLLALDALMPRDVHVHIRDLLLLTVVGYGYGWHLYKIGHH